MNTSLSYDRGLLGHLAEHMLYLSTTPSFWYSLNSSFDHGFHLSHRLGMPHLTTNAFLLQQTWLIITQNGASTYWLIGEKFDTFARSSFYHYH
jgi:hypothetical protein